ncbi:hypothetical protein ACFYWU_26300 [Streptomyces chrestomyceticus]|uniref:hypothetical protein n=1 Tax=Streptomyces chrestomyceticus TaxID=68185 RepID=UPI0036826EE4
MNRGGCRGHRSAGRTGALVLIAVLIALCGAAPAALEPGAGPAEAAAMSAEPAADDSFPQVAASRVPRAGRTGRSPEARALVPSLPCHTGRLARLLAHWTDLRSDVRDAAGDRAHHTVLRC